MKKILSTLIITALLCANTAKVTATQYQIGVYYFAMWNPNNVKDLPALNTLANAGCLRTYGRQNDQWCGLRDFVAGNSPGWTGDFSYLKPVIGYYDDTDPRTYEKHIKQATQNGISYFAFYYYWNPAKHVEYLKSSMDAFLRAQNKNDIKFVLSSHFIHQIPNSQFQEMATSIVTRYFTQSNYLKLPNGQPIFILSDSRNLGDAAGTAASVQTFLNILKTTTSTKLGKTPYIVADASSVPLELSYDGYTCRANAGLSDTLANPTDKVGDYTRYVAAAPHHDTYGKPFLSCAMENFDERPRTGIVIAHDNIRYTTGWSPEKFRQMLVKEKQFMDARSDTLSKMLTLYAWNEWHEGGIIEPNARDGAKLLNIIALVFGLTAGTDSCRTTGNCSALTQITPGDFNYDGHVNILDYNILVGNFRVTYTIQDYNTLVANFGK